MYFHKIVQFSCEKSLLPQTIQHPAFVRLFPSLKQSLVGLVHSSFKTLQGA